MSDKVEVIIRKKGFWTLTAEGTQTLTLPSGKVFNAGTIGELPKNVRDHLLEYGFRQKLADAGAVGKDAPEEDRIDGMNKRLVQLRSGDLSRVNAGKGMVKISNDSLKKLDADEIKLLEKITGRKIIVS